VCVGVFVTREFDLTRRCRSMSLDAIVLRNIASVSLGLLE